MVFSNGFLDHAAEVYLRTNGLIMSAQQQPQQQQPQPPQQQQQQLQTQQLQTQQLQTQQQQMHQSLPLYSSSSLSKAQILQTIQTIMQDVKPSVNGQPAPARAILLCHPSSHQFQTRNITLEPHQEVKVGRSVPRCRVEETNAIFDCKVLSRNHATMWFNDGKFFLKDTGSSNGTFINNHRIKASEPYEISSNDIVQFGVDVTENSRKETHGCIIAILMLITPEGIEKTSNQPSPIGHLSFDNDIFRLKQIMHESYVRELILEEKLLNLQKEVQTTKSNSTNSWQAMIHEDLLLSRIDILENKLQCVQKNMTNDKLIEDISKLQEEKSAYQKTAKEALKKVYQDRMAIIQKFTKFEQLWQSSEDELALLRSQLVASNENNEKLSQEMINANSDMIRTQIAKQEEDCKQIRENFEAAKRENDVLKNRLQLIANLNECDVITDNGGDASDKNKNITMWNKQAIVHWLNETDLKKMNVKECDELFSAIFNDINNKENWKIDPQKCSKLYDKLLEIEKKILSIDNKTTEESNSETASIKSEESVSTINDGNQNNEQINDGNQNKKENSQKLNENIDVTTFRNVIDELKEMYNEFLIQVKLLETDLISASKDEETKKKLESLMAINARKKRRKVRDNVMNSFETVVSQKSIQLNGQKTIEFGDDDPSDDDEDGDDDDNDDVDDDDEDDDDDIDDEIKRYTDNIKNNQQNNVNNNNTTQNLNLKNLNDEFNDQSCDTISTISTIDINNTNSIETKSSIDDRNDDKSLTEQNVSNTSSQYDESFITQIDKNNQFIDDYDLDEKEALESFDRIIDDECKLINDTDILREEELITLKERCVKLTDENLSLRNDNDNLRLNNSKQITMLLYTAPLAVIIGYLLSLIFS